MLDNFLTERLTSIKDSGLLRILRTVQSAPAATITINGKEFINFSSNNYLDLAGNKEIYKSAVSIIEKYGFTAASSRLVSGNLSLHEELESKLAEFKNKEACLLFPSGYQTNVGVISALISNESESCIIMDKLNHASLWDGAKLSGGRIFVYDHCDMNSLEKTLRRTSKYKMKLAITESVFSMDGDFTPLEDFALLCKKYDAIIMLDEAHSTGVFGKEGKGLADFFGVEDKIDITVGTLSKAFALQGGFVCGSKKFIDFLINKSRAFIYTTAVSPAICAAALKALEIVKKSEERRYNIHSISKTLKTKLSDLELDTSKTQSQIIPIITRSIANAEKIALNLLKEGVYAPAIKHPTVPKEQARVRISLTSGHTLNDIEKLLKSVGIY
ncbi:MAG: pyridoxal phosphate-dependent aminotransferase family protein [Endomicrobium sp.]|jgi:8-amino-7-oxononanoate synthase|nr:pyridoxal phosphate-dependent aminotransferase family protein [Endomicrobium sp.]